VVFNHTPGFIQNDLESPLYGRVIITGIKPAIEPVDDEFPVRGAAFSIIKHIIGSDRISWQPVFPGSKDCILRYGGSRVGDRLRSKCAPLCTRGLRKAYPSVRSHPELGVKLVEKAELEAYVERPGCAIIMASIGLGSACMK
jgi:hypothetical protein